MLQQLKQEAYTEKIKCSHSPPGSRLPSQLLWQHLPQAAGSATNDQREHRYREVWTLKAKPFYLGIYIYGLDFRNIWELCMVSLNTQVLLYIYKGVRFRKVQGTFIFPLNGVSLVCWLSEAGKRGEEQLWCRIPPKAAATLGLARNTVISTLYLLSVWSSKDDENEKCHSAAFHSHGFHSPFTALFLCHTTALMENCTL